MGHVHDAVFKEERYEAATLENELLSILQCDTTIAQYFHKVNSICRGITELDPKCAIGEGRLKRIIIHELWLEYRSFIIAVQGWPAQPSLVQFENLLASQEAMAKQMGGITLQGEEEVLYTSESRSNNKSSTKRGYKNGDKRKSHQGNAQPGRAQKNDNNKSLVKRFGGICYNCGKKGHMSRDCWSKKILLKATWHPLTWRWRRSGMQKHYVP